MKAWIVYTKEGLPISVGKIRLNAIRRAVELYRGYQSFAQMEVDGFNCVRVKIVKEGK